MVNSHNWIKSQKEIRRRWKLKMTEYVKKEVSFARLPQKKEKQMYILESKFDFRVKKNTQAKLTSR